MTVMGEATKVGKRLALTWLVVAATGSAAFAQNADRVKMLDGRTYRGNVFQISATEVGLQRGSAGDETLAANEIESITFEGEPRPLAMARTFVGVGRYEEALAALDQISGDTIDRDFIKQDAEYYRALCLSRLALGGQGKLSTAGSAMHRFTTDAVLRESYHYYDACATLGELLAASKRYDKAIEYYARLAKAPWPDQQMRGQVLSGRALVAQQKYPEAIAQFDQVLAHNTDTEKAQKQQMEARLAKAICLAATDGADEGIRLVTEVLQQAAADDDKTRAAAYRTRGHCYLKVGEKQGALLDFLHIDLLYNSNPETHAEALYELAKLWPTVGKGRRGREAMAMLKQQYPNSRWAKMQPDAETGDGGRGAF